MKANRLAEPTAIHLVTRVNGRYTADGAEIADTNRYRPIGNAVAVPCVEWIAGRVMGFLS